jgi:hypothetical protein
VRLGDAEQRGHRGEAHHRSPGGGERAQHLGQQRGPHEVDGEDAAPVGHRGRDPRGVGDGPQRAELDRAGREPGEAVAVGDVDGERLDRGAGVRRRHLVGHRRHGRLVAVDQHHGVDHVDEASGALQTHPAPGARRDADGMPRHATSSSPR